MGDGLWDRLPGAKERDEGMDRVQSPIVTAAWLPYAREALNNVAQTRAYLTSEDVWEQLRAWDIGEPSDNRAMGPVMRWGEAEGLIERTDRYIRANRSSRHRAPIQLYKSKVFRG